MTSIGSLPDISLNVVSEQSEEIDEELPEEVADEEELREELAQYTLEGKWVKVVEMYRKNPQAHTVTINDSMDTALHVAIDLDEEDHVRYLVDAILTHGPQKAKKNPLEMENERGDTPLHVAASRGFAKICLQIIGQNAERLYLRSNKNKLGETPLFLAALNRNKQAFAYLSATCRERITLKDLVRNDGDSILHCAIRREYFDLAIIIVHYFDFLITHTNKDEFTPLKVLDTRPSAFKSGIKLSWWKLILYHCILVEPLDAQNTIEKNLIKMKQTGSTTEFPKNYEVCVSFSKSFSVVVDRLGKLLCKHGTENQPYVYQGGHLPPNYATIRQFVKSAYLHSLGLSGVALKEVRKTKKKHQWSDQLFKALMKNPYEAFTGRGGRPETIEQEILDLYIPTQGTPSQQDSKKGTKPSDEGKDTDIKMTPFLVAAKYGIVEMVTKIQRQIPSVIHNTNSKRENVLLVAVKNRQPQVVQALEMVSKKEVWSNLILGVDNDENTVLHLAAQARQGEKPWQIAGLGLDNNENTVLHLAAQAQQGEKPWRIAGAALQMMWDVKWYQYIKSKVPQHCYFRSNKELKTAGEIFKTSHEDLVQKGSEWLKETSESCSVVAALVAGVSFATASAVPGGNNDEGEPPLEGKPAFDAFAIASLIGLCFSVTGLIMFLSILTSRKEARDFRRGLPLKLLLGLSSLFVSIIAMFVSFCSGHFFIINEKYKTFLFPFYAATSLPVAFYALAQFPLYFDLLTTIITKVPQASDIGDTL